MSAEAVGKLLGVDRSYISRWLNRSRGQTEQGGISARIVYRMIKELQLDPEKLFFVDPPPRFWQVGLPRGRDPDPEYASPTSPQPTRHLSPGEGDALRSRGKKVR